MRTRLVILALLVLATLPAIGGELELADGVVVKLGAGGELIVRDGLLVHGEVVFTSLTDDSVGGITGAQPGVPAPGDWLGIRLERSAPQTLVELQGLELLYGGNGIPAFTLAGTQIPLVGLAVRHSGDVGLAALPGTTGALSQLVLTGNAVGLQAAEGSSVTLSTAVISGNTIGAENLDPASPIPAAGIWWGHPTGPLDDSDDTGSGGLYNPGALGNAVSDGILYTAFENEIPLFGLGVGLAMGDVALDPDVLLKLMGPTAIGVRLAEDPGFPAIPFEPFERFKDFTFVGGDGQKTVHAEFQAATGNTATISTQINLDSVPPTLTVSTPTPGAVLARPITVLAQAMDAAGVDRVEFLVDGNLAAVDTTNDFEFDWDVRLLPNGPHVLTVIAVDGQGRETRLDIDVNVALTPPPAPVITSPVSGTTIGGNAVDVSGTAGPGTQVSLLINGAFFQQATPDGLGNWSIAQASVIEGPNTLVATSIDSVGTSAPSAIVEVTVDNGAPDPPPFITAVDLADGVKEIQWIPPAASDVASYNLWRGTTPFTLTSEATLILGAIGGLSATETPPSEGTFHYGVTAVDDIGNESLLSPLIEITFDLTPPTGQVIFTPSGPVGPGSVGVQLDVSEDLDGPPFLSITPAGGSPITVDLSGGPLTWMGNLEVLAQTQTGTAAVTYSARDLADNRGTQLTAGQTLLIDTRGPQGSVAVTPSQTTYGPGAYTVDLTLDEAAAVDPVLTFVPPTGGPLALSVTGAGASWQATLTVEAGQGDGTATFELDAQDALGNTTTGAIADASIELDLTPPGVPNGLVATSLPAGEIEVDWTVVPGADSYTLYRVPSGQPIDGTTPPLTTGLAAPPRIDLPPSDGVWTYSVSAVDALTNESGFAPPVTASSDRTPPSDPSGLTLQTEGDSIRANWTPGGAPTADSFSLYRSTDPIVTLSGLEAVQTELVTPTALDRPPADGDWHYAVTGLDLIGNESNFTTAGPLTFDQAGPVITIGGVVDGQVAGEPLTITFSATDFDLQSLEATLNTAPFASGTLVTAEGGYTLVVDAADGSGNTSQETVVFAIDLTDPLIEIAGVADGVLYETPVTPVITVTEERPATTTILLNAAPFVSGTTIDADGAYALDVQATDLAGNSAAALINFTVDTPPPAVDFLVIELAQGGFPLLDWTPRPEPDVVGYLVRRDGIDLTPGPIPGTTFTDTTFNPFSPEQIYEVVAVDAANHESQPRAATLSRSGVALTAYGTADQLTRLYIDRIDVAVTNNGAVALEDVSLELTLRDGPTELGSRMLDLTDPLAPGEEVSFEASFAVGEGVLLTRSLDLALTLPSQEGSLVRVLRTETLEVREPPRPIEIFNDPLVLGATGQFRLKLFNHGSVPIQIVTARANDGVSDVQAELYDLDGNLLGAARLDQGGAGTVSTAGLTFVEIGPGSSFLTEEIAITVPSAAGDQVVLQATVDATHTDLTGFSPPNLSGSALLDSAPINTGEPPYLATAMADKDLYDEGETVVISGTAFDTATGLPQPNVVVKVGINTRGFDRNLAALADANGDYTTTFEPVTGEAGSYSIWGTHPSVVERSSQDTFDILGLALSPRAFNLRMSKNATFPLTLRLTNTGEVDLSGISFETLGGNGVSGTVDSSGLPSRLTPGQRGTVIVNIDTTIDADDANFLTATITTAEGATRFFDVSLELLEAIPLIDTQPSFVEAGVPNGTQAVRTVRIENRGFAPLEGVVLEEPELEWITLGVNPALPPIPVSGFADVPVIFTPPADLTPGIYSDRFNIVADNHPTFRENLFAVVTSSTTGEALFEVRNTENVLLDGANVWIQNLQVPELRYTKLTDANGQARFQELPSGPYQFRIEATGTETSGGRFDIEPDQVTTLPIFNNVVYVTLEWSVVPVIIEDRYEFTVEATFETSVPAPVLLIDPPYFQLQLEPGAVFVGEYTLKNFGLVAVDDVLITPSAGNGATLETLVSEIPRLGANKTVAVPFRLTLAPFEFPSEGGKSASRSADLARAISGYEKADDDGFNPCAPIPARVSNYGIYPCAAGFLASAAAGLEFSISTPETESIASRLGFCDDDCSICNCANIVSDVLGGICECVTSPSICGCLKAFVDDDKVDTVCDCLGGGSLTENAINCVKSVVGIDDPVSAVLDTVKDIVGCAKCVCNYLPGLCDFSFDPSPARTTGPGHGPSTGGTGRGWSGVFSNATCEDPG